MDFLSKIIIYLQKNRIESYGDREYDLSQFYKVCGGSFSWHSITLIGLGTHRVGHDWSDLAAEHSYNSEVERWEVARQFSWGPWAVSFNKEGKRQWDIEDV